MVPRTPENRWKWPETQAVFLELRFGQFAVNSAGFNAMGRPTALIESAAKQTTRRAFAHGYEHRHLTFRLTTPRPTGR
jgi:hypothetical protein